MTTQKIGELDEHCRLHNLNIVLSKTGNGKRVGIPSMTEQEYYVGQTE